jgi:glycosyltransferase involved in cell wall biosynthesis
MKTVMFVANRGYAIISSRKEILQKFIEMKWKVIIVTSDDEYSQKMVELGVILESISFKRRQGSNIFDISTLLKLSQIIRKYKPDLVHNFHAKPIIYCSIVSRLLLGKSTHIVNTVTGLGRSIPNSKYAKFFSIYAYRIACGCSDKVIFQNSDDRMLFIDNKICLESKSELIISAGVDVDKFPYNQRRIMFDSKPVVVMVGRLLESKGVYHFIDIAEHTSKFWPNITFYWAGEEDLDHPEGVDLSTISENNHVKFLGKVDDIYSLLIKADIMIFPSYYKEGVPRAILEGASSGLPVIAYNVPGVREAVVDKCTGIVVPVVSSKLMSKALVALLHDHQKRQEMGKEAQKMIISRFKIQTVHQKYFDVYRDVGVLN